MTTALSNKSSLELHMFGRGFLLQKYVQMRYELLQKVRH